METRRINRIPASESVPMSEALMHLRSGQAVVFPTDTVCGIGISVNHNQSPQLLFDLKGRPSDKPVQWLIPSIDALSIYGRSLKGYAADLAHEFWPGALTIVVEASNAVPPAFLSHTGTIGLRMPDCTPLLRLMDALESPLATTSANPSGHSPASTIDQVDAQWLSDTGCFVFPFNVRSTDGSAGSTVVDCTGLSPTVLRQGSVSI